MERHDIRRATDSGWTPLASATRGGRLQVVKLFLEHGDGKTPMYTAASDGYVEVMKLLLEHGARADVQTTVDREV
ncbi:Hypothetical protein D9617_48g089440 [Elsinoe fawcettii]|nr:Hypothetical protein D9617_48g089440 [Elsinoe fawcettii]